MKFISLFFTALLPVMSLFAQSPEENFHCSDKCSRSGSLSRVQQVTYFQYPSMNKYDVKYLKLDINAETASRVISGTALTRAIALAPLDSFITELRDNMIVDSVFINGVKKTFTRSADHVFISLSPSIPTGSTVTALFYYRGTANSNGVFAGTSASNGLSYTATLSESYQAREWFPAKQFLRDKIDSADIWVTTSSINKVGSNGLLQGVDVLPAGKSRYRWKTTYPMSYYMPSIAVGNYMEYLNYAKPLAIAPDSILIQHYLADNVTYFNSVKTNIDKTPAFIEKLSELYGLYPFHEEKYGHAQANIGGGMEHQTMSTMAGFGSTLIAHELGHQWWGDNITCASWNDIWLNEGFASYTEYLLIEKLPALFSTTTPSAYMQGIHDNVMSSPTGSVYVPNASIFDEGRIFSGRLSYNKGSAIINNLRFEFQNDNLFFQALQNFQNEFKDSAVTTEEFRQSIEATSGRSFSDFFNQWYYGEGYPTFNITYFRPNSDSLLLLVNETTSAAGVTPFFKGLLELKITSESGDTTVLINLAANNQIYKFRTRKVPSGIIVDPNNWMLNQTGTITNGIVVPVNFTSIQANAGNDCAYTVQWKTAQESNVSRYEVEYSTDAIHFNTKTFVTNNQSGNYSVRLTDIPGNKVYFRIRAIEADGSSRYTPVASAVSTCNGQLVVETYPNPVLNEVKISLSKNSAGYVNIRLLNATGQLIRKEKYNLQSGETMIRWNVENLASGNYLLEVQHSSGEMVRSKLVKQ